MKAHVRKNLISLISFLIPIALVAQWPLFDVGSLGEMGGVYIHTNGHIFITGEAGIFEKSNDCGITWNDVDAIFFNDIGSIEFPTNQVGYVTADDGFFGKTVNGGNSWIFASTPAPDNLQSSFFFDELHGYMVGRDGAIIHTLDGGASWSTQVSGVTSRLEGVYFVDIDHGIVTGRNNTLLYTQDGGNTWTNITAGTIGDLKTIAFPSPGNGFIAAEGGVYSINADLSSVSLISLDPLIEFNDIHFASETLGWICGGSGTVYGTNNGGATWTLMELAGSPFELSSIYGETMNKVFTVGEFGKVNGLCGDVGTGIIGISHEIIKLSHYTFSENELKLNFFSENNLHANIEMIDLQGKRISILNNIVVHQGENELLMTGLNIPPSIYVIRISAIEGQQAFKVVITD